MQLEVLDWAIIAGYFAIALGIGLWFKNKAGSSFVEYFASGRSLPWWIAGTSMVATTFAADTPLAVTGLVAKYGLAGNWFWWSWAFGGMLTVFVFARLWRRAEVLTDVELIELRYHGEAAAFLRGFRGFYIAVVMNSIVIGWVTKAMAQVLQQTVLFDPEATVQGFDNEQLLLIAGMLAITGVYSIVSGLWGVAITDMVQFVLAMGGCIGLAIVAVAHIGGVDALQERLAVAFEGQDPLAYLPDFSSAGDGSGATIPLGIFLVLVLSQWWATWYPGAEPGGGGYIVQRMASCKDEQHAVKATLFFQLAHYCLRPWPWILVAFVAIALHPELRAEGADAGAGYPMLIRELAPVGLRGLLLVTFAAAFMSTISTQMNWGASYLVNDVYRRFVAPDADDRQLMRASRLASGLVLLLGGLVAWAMLAFGVSVDQAWAFLAALGAGVGAVFILRWFWWRINVWSELVAMVGSLLLFSMFAVLTTGKDPGSVFSFCYVSALDELPGEYRALIVAAGTLVLWLIATVLTRPEPDGHLAAFYRKVRPSGPGWGPIAALTPDVRPDGDLGRGLVCAVLGTAIIWLTLPAIGAMIFGDWGKGLALAGGAAVCAVVLLQLARPRAHVLA
ncbi:MAG: Na+:solute symporter [Planctomycetes bacterium]|nr:Na+:solute symporter [Planctomycetota bacterium]